MAVLVVAALFWGNYFSCPQVLLSVQKHSCCPHGKANPGKCETQGMRSFAKVEKALPAIPAMAAMDAIAAPVLAARTESLSPLPAAIEITPPDLLPLRI
jgi:hypothetical protein